MHVKKLQGTVLSIHYVADFLTFVALTLGCRVRYLHWTVRTDDFASHMAAMDDHSAKRDLCRELVGPGDGIRPDAVPCTS